MFPVIRDDARMQQIYLQDVYNVYTKIIVCISAGISRDFFKVTRVEPSFEKGNNNYINSCSCGQSF